MKNNENECFVKEYKNAVKTLKRDCKNINPCKFGIIHKRGDYFVYKGFETEEKMKKNDWTCNVVILDDISKMRFRGYYKLLDILFDIKNRMTKLYREELYCNLPKLRTKQ